jgi:hypothetical protein
MAMHLLEAIERGEAEPVMEAAPPAAEPITVSAEPPGR